MLSMFGSKFVLPQGTQREDNKDMEEIAIPVSHATPILSSERRIPILEFDFIGKSAFKGYDTLNRVQSIVYPIAYQTNENLLVCAPTGAVSFHLKQIYF